MNNNLNTFKVLYIVKGILTLLFSLLFIIYMGFGFFFSGIDEMNEAPFNMGMIFVFIGAVGFFLALIVGILTLITAKFLGEARNYNFIFGMAIVNCLTGVLGIILGVFTIIELNKPQVRELFGRA